MRAWFKIAGYFFLTVLVVGTLYFTIGRPVQLLPLLDPIPVFEITDELLDVAAGDAVAGKRVGKDAEAGKATFVSLLRLEGARARAAELVAEAEAALAGYGKGADNLIAAARFVIARDS